MALNVRGSDSLWWSTGIDTGGLEQGAAKSKGILRGLASQISAMDIFAAVSVGAAYHIQKSIKEITVLAARYETMGVVMRNVGANAGYSASEMNRFQAGLEETGISMLKARQALTMMTQAQMDLNKSAQLARVAQDAAVIGNINSSDAFEKMVYGIQSGQIEVLRTIGLNVNFENSYMKVAKATDRASTSFSEAEKTQIRLNTVLEAGTKIAGTYEGAMDTAGKQALSLERHVENLKVLAGQLFLPVYSEIITQITAALVGMTGALEKDSVKISEWGNNLSLTMIRTEIEIGRVASAIILAGKLASPAFLRGHFDKEYKESLETLKALAERYVAVQDKMRGIKVAGPSADAMDMFYGYTNPKPSATGGTPTDTETAAERKKRIAAIKKDTADFIQERSDMMEEAREEDDKYFEWQTHRSEDSLKAEIARIEKEIAMHGEAWSYKMGWIDDLESKKKELAGKEKDRADKERDDIEAIADIQKTYADDMQKYLEKRAKETEDIYRELASFIGDIDSDLGKAIRNVGEILTLVSMIRKEGTSSIAQATGAIGILGSAFSILQMFTGGSGISQYERTMQKLADDTERLQKAQALMVGEAVIQGYKDIEVSVKSRVAEISRELLVWQAYQAALGKKDALGALGMNAQSHIDQLNADLADTKIELDEIQQKLETTLTGTTADSITDAIAEGFENGLSEAEVFAKTFNQLMAAALKDAFKRAMLDKVVTQWYSQFSALAESGLTADEMKILSESLRTGFADITTLWDSIAVIAQQAGVSLTDTTGTAATGMTGAIAGITEETAGLLAGQFQNLIMNSVRSREILTNINDGKLMPSLNAISEIRNNSYYLDDIYARSDMSLNALVEIRNGAYYLDDIYNRLAPVSNINDNISLMLLVAQDNLKENRRTANNTEHLKGIALTMKTSGYNSLPRSIGA